jgi:hypothetical protein
MFAISIRAAHVIAIAYAMTLWACGRHLRTYTQDCVEAKLQTFHRSLQNWNKKIFKIATRWSVRENGPSSYPTSKDMLNRWIIVHTKSPCCLVRFTDTLLADVCENVVHLQWTSSQKFDVQLFLVTSCFLTWRGILAYDQVKLDADLLQRMKLM